MSFFDFSKRRSAIPSTPAQTEVESGGWEVLESPMGSDHGGTPSRWFASSGRESSPELGEDSMDDTLDSLNSTHNSVCGRNVWVANGQRNYTTPPFSRRAGPVQLSSSSSSIRQHDASATLTAVLTVLEDSVLDSPSSSSSRSSSSFQSASLSSSASAQGRSPRERLAELAYRIRGGSSTTFASTSPSDNSICEADLEQGDKYESLVAVNRGLVATLDTLDAALASYGLAREQVGQWFSGINEKLMLELSITAKELAGSKAGREEAPSNAVSPCSSAASRDATLTSSPPNLPVNLREKLWGLDDARKEVADEREKRAAVEAKLRAVQGEQRRQPLRLSTAASFTREVKTGLA